MPEHVVAIAGMPRSGTSWLGAIFDSSPDVIYRFQPIFSYAHKDAVDELSDEPTFRRFFADIYRSDDPFVTLAEQRAAGTYPTFEKRPDPAWLVFKNVRYHHLLKPLLERVDDIKAVAIVRHPCGSINSWLRSPREFPAEADPSSEWRHGRTKKAGRREEFWGFDDWKTVTRLHVNLAEQEPERFLIVRYERLVADPLAETSRVFGACGLQLEEQTHSFLARCHEIHRDDPYAVFKSPEVADRWRHELDADIRDVILAEVASDHGLRRFISP
jgi:hypothetical protein